MKNGIMDTTIFQTMQSNVGESVNELSQERTVMLIFLRHFGCTFCRAALAEISKKKEQLESNGTRIVFVHMSDNNIADEYFGRYGIKNPIHVSDPECDYYQKFGLVKGNFKQLFGLNTWIRGFQEGVINKHGIGKQLGDSFQMPGIFLILRGEIREKYIHRFASDRPDYEKLAACCQI